MRMKRIAVLALTFCMIFGVMVVNADYLHRVKVSAGNGTFDSDPGTGTSATIDISARTVTVKDAEGTEVSKSEVTTFPDGKDADSSKYFILGMKIAGHDNAQEKDSYVFTDTVNIYSGSALPSYKEKDTDLVVAYGLKSNMVGYTVRYVDENGNPLLSDGHYYGTIGTPMVVSYMFVDGYIPNAYAESRELKANEADNVFTFTYEKYTGTGQVIVINDGTIVINGGGAGGAGAGAGGAGAGAGGAGAAGAGGDGAANIGEGDVPQAGPADIVNLDDDGTPTTDNPDGATDIENGNTPKTNWGLIGGGAALVAAIAAAVLAIAKRRRDEDAEEDDEE